MNVDLWGPATVKNKNENDYKIHAMTMIGPATGWFEVAPALKMKGKTLRGNPISILWET